MIPPTELYNEGWLLRVALDWFSTDGPSDSQFSFSPGRLGIPKADLLLAFSLGLVATRRLRDSPTLTARSGIFRCPRARDRRLCRRLMQPSLW